MRIEEYSFGNIVVDGRAYNSDVIIYPDRVDDRWWRAEGHLLQLSDVRDILEARPDVLVVGTGFAGCMHVDKAVDDELRSRAIELIVLPTGEAWKAYNRLQVSGKIVAALHLTC